MSYSFQNPSQDIIKSYLENAKTIAIVGLSHRQETAAYKVAAFLQSVGYHILPVNPKLAGQEILGEKVYRALQDIPVSIDIVDIFRPSPALAGVARDFIETDAKVFWSQLGLESQEAEQVLREAGHQAIVMNKCTKIEHKQLMLD
ncbi:CoA-binding protein [Streptococcus didelphis]|uniref:CoA-binding protein n=1 Tax=Streptococcus didelphis TaxID=102886 RepID=A0ABY9LHT0_9STRE|nr:CoA-binding protein [Streptococcus didelphis]WMB27720.1 CoA-binding protein [Streptococcus didelphis]